MVSNYYQVLGVSSDATQDEIRQRYEHLALEHRIPGTKPTTMYTAIKTAHTVLSNPVKKERYDLNQKLIQMHEDEARKALKEEKKHWEEASKALENAQQYEQQEQVHREEASKALEKAQQYEQQEQVHREKASKAFERARKWKHEAQKLRRARPN
ncbi:hypothetical protein NLU13_1994 [Sarocladium strictum]|uniref:J domain-containing protein n=1 Tax=Sarocladium strictum TaxID=5046 RepID=A0AA39GTY3_SARSR|nr:hypothetical protein NLU13_1994 [Sarocladium strictum]